MNFITENLSQRNKTGNAVCGDFCLRERSDLGLLYVLCDGIGSGVYANIAAILNANRLAGLIKGGLSQREAAELVAASMHRARTEDIPYSAFSVAVIMRDGYFTVHTYEAPAPILLTQSGAGVLPARFYTTEYEVVAEYEGRMREGDALILMSDGVTQSGMGHGYGMGIGSEGVADFINRHPHDVENLNAMPARVTDYCASLAAGRTAKGRHEDDTTFALLTCRKAAELTLLTGPPSRKGMDRSFAELILDGETGKKVVCGSTTLDIVSRELERPVEIAGKVMPGIPPEYTVEGVDLALEGAITLNQVCNIIDEPIEEYEEEDNPAQKLCLMLREADIIHLHIGMAVNDAHESLIFKQAGIKLRRRTVELLAEKLKAFGKLVLEYYY